MKRTIIGGLVLLVAGHAAVADVATLNTVKDHAGIIEDNFSSFAGGTRDNTLWGMNGVDTKERRGLVEFAQLSPAVRAGLGSGAYTLDSVTLRLTSTANTWTSTTLNFGRLLDANTGWTETQTTYGRKDTVADLVWVDSLGVNAYGGGDMQQVFGTLTSTGDGTGGVVYDVSFTGSQLVEWLSSDTIAPNMFVLGVGATGAQTRFAMRENTTYAAPQLIVSYTIPEPATLGLVAAMGGTLLFIRRRLAL